MAGAGYKLFATGDVLTAAQVNTYLNEQTVMVFADSAARTTALSGVLAEGMMSYLQDTDSVEVYDGTSWTAVGGGGLTSPLTTKGDVWGYSTTDARIPVGANGTVLTADSAETLGVKWAASASGGGMTLVETLTLSGASTTSASIAGTYKHLFVVVKGTTASTNTDFYLRMNGDSGSNYFRNVITTAAPSTISGSGVSSQAEIRLSDIGTATHNLYR
jgi:trimeric autotransporter adhesin